MFTIILRRPSAFRFSNFDVEWVGRRSDFEWHAGASSAYKLVSVFARVAKEDFGAYFELDALATVAARSATAAHLFDDASRYPPGFVVLQPFKRAGGLVSYLALHVVG
jgi:hypothetical protein